MGYVDVDEMLASVPSSLLTEWKAYETIAGPLGESYVSEILASINELLQQLVILTAQDKGAKVQHVPRPHELHEQQRLEQQRSEQQDEDVVGSIDRMFGF